MKTPLKVVLLTTDTTHHSYYAWKLNQHVALHAIFTETRQISAPFDTFHPFETLRDAYERDVLLAGFNSKLADLADTRVYNSINDPESMETLLRLSPDVVFVFGTGKLTAPVIQAASVACLNFHGGNPEQYRGLDTHLWAIYHNDFDNLVTTLHHMDAELDAGDIVVQTQLKLHRDSNLYQLRATNTQACVDLSVLTLHSLHTGTGVPCRKQVLKGRYYSFMPASLKEECVKKFNRFVGTL